jgi:hypothetical protein
LVGEGESLGSSPPPHLQPHLSPVIATPKNIGRTASPFLYRAHSPRNSSQIWQTCCLTGGTPPRKAVSRLRALLPKKAEESTRTMTPRLWSPTRATVSSPPAGPDLLSVAHCRAVLSHIISQLRPGADLSRVVLPTFILEPRSMLERITKYGHHPQ